MRRRTKPRVVWVPNTNANSLGAFGRSTTQQFFVNVASAAPGGSAVGEVPIVIDSQDDVLDPATTLSDIENSGYRLRRIVGKIWCFRSQTTPDAPRVIVTAALIIRRSNPADGASYALTTGDATLINPQDNVNQGDPWIWRRAWVLFNENLGNSGPGPTSNIEYGSVADGPHVDAKTARIVSSEERLFLDVSVTNIEGGAGAEVEVFADLRVLASMRTSSGNRRNASR